MSLLNKFESGDSLQKKSHVKNLIKMASADGSIDEVEINFLQKIAKKYGVDQDEVQHIIDNPNNYAFTPPANKTDRHAQLLNLVIMMMIDGVIDDNEMAMVRKFAIGLGYHMAKVDKVIKMAIECVSKNIDEDDAIEALDEA